MICKLIILNVMVALLMFHFKQVLFMPPQSCHGREILGGKHTELAWVCVLVSVWQCVWALTGQRLSLVLMLFRTQVCSLALSLAYGF